MKNKGVIKVVIAEQSAILRSGVATVLRRSSEFDFMINEIGENESMRLFLRMHTPDLLIINPLFVAGLNINDLKKEYPSLKTAILQTSFLDTKIIADYDFCLSIYDSVEEIGAKLNFLFRNSEGQDLPTESSLSLREKEIISYVVRGFTNKLIAETLTISIHTVIAHRRNIARKLQIHSSAGLTIYAIAHRIVSIEDVKSQLE